MDDTGKIYKAARILAGLSVGELADRAGVSRPTVTRLESSGSLLHVNVLKIKQVLEQCGVEIFEDQESEGIRRKKQPKLL